MATLVNINNSNSKIDSYSLFIINAIDFAMGKLEQEEQVVILALVRSPQQFFVKIHAEIVDSLK